MSLAKALRVRQVLNGLVVSVTGYWSWRKIVAGVAWSLVLLGVAPVGHLCWWGFTHSPRPVSMPFPLKRGEYSSHFFKTESNESYEIGIEWDRSRGEWKALDLDWKLVDDSGALLKQGTYKYRLRGNTAVLGQYQSTRRLRQRIIVRNLRDAQGLDLAHPKLEISLPERSLDISYASLDAIMLAFMIAGPGMLILLFLLIARTLVWNAPNRGVHRSR